jgi:protein gp37
MAEFSEWLQQQGITWPTNLWAGTSITTQKMTSRIVHLLKVGNGQTLRYLSVEPRWESIDLRPWLPRLNWIIQGGESGGSRAESFQLEWAREMRRHCAEAGVPYFLKQLGRRVLDGEERIQLKHSHGGDWNEWPSDLKVRQMPVQSNTQK